MKRFILTLLVVVTTISACKKDADPTFIYAGNYKGSYTGDDQGSLQVTVDVYGDLTGTGLSANSHESFEITGKVDTDGKFSGITDVGTVYVGTFNSSAVNGTWNNTASKISGSWTGNKQ